MASHLHRVILQSPVLLLLVSLVTHHHITVADPVLHPPRSWPEVYKLLNPAHNDKVCSTWGNHHYKTFDGVIYQFPGPCNYIFASDCINTCEDFNIQIRHSDETGKTVLTYVLIKMEGLNIEMKKGKITIGEEMVSLPFSQFGVQIQKTSVYVKLTAKLGLTLLWNNEDALMLKLSPKYMNTTCGLCGNMNGVSQDEFRIDDMILIPVEYGNMQKLDGPTEQCEDVDFSTPENCIEMKQVCVQMLSSPAFRDCDVRVPKNPYIQACISDLCICQSSNNMSCFCDTLAEYSRQCANAGGRPRNWRNNMCEISCPMNLKYDECGSPCADTCSNCERTLVCEEPCIEGCFCPSGTVLDDVNNQGCIPFSECPCTYNRRIYSPGESFSNNCQKCICQGGQWDCKALPCPGHCSLEGGSHIYTYDGGHYNFHGDCSYIFTKDCVENMFNIVIELRKCGITHTETCLKSVTLFLEKGLTVITVKYSGAVLLNGIYAPTPLFTDNFALLQPSSFYLIVKSFNGIQMQIQLDPVMQLSVSLDPEYMGNACGLCGDFNNIRTDDFRAANGVLEGTASAFANSWKSFGNCADVKDSYENPCSLSVENERYAQHWCSLLLDGNGPFAPCHSTVNPTIYKTNCMYDSCNYEKSEDSVCAALGAYVRACAAEGVILEGWRDAICDKYTKKCSKNSTYHYSISTCQKTCRSLSEPDPSCKFKFPSVDGCACPRGTYLDESGACVLDKQCPCYYRGSIMSPGEVIYEHGAMCTCQSGRLYCIGKVPINAVCPTNMVYFDCASASVGEKGADCQKTCQTLDLECFSTQCTSGCICPDDLVLNNNGRCIPEKKCPCVHDGEVYYSGETIQQDCNTCTCRDRKWQCTKKECHKTCVVYGEGHYVTFDGKRFDFSGDCEYTLTQDYCNTGNHSFRVITENIPCGTTGVTCSKAIKIFLGMFELKLSESSYEVLERDVGSEVPYQVRQLGMFLVIEADNGLIVMWDKKTTIIIKLSPELQGHVCGLCGNCEGSVLNDFTTRSQSVVVNVLEFGNSWKASPSCPDALPLSDPCLINPYRQTWSQKHCSIIIGSTFSKCHSKLDPTPYHDACVHDTCACDSGGDCECFCTAVAAYAAACSQAGICVSWRTPEICPLFCDYYNPEGECEWHYKPCGEPCLRTCRNPSGQCMNYLPGLEGCYPKCPKKRPIFDEDIMKCIAHVNCGCYDDDGKRYNVGDVVPSYKNCESCACTKKGLRCQMDVRACYCYYENTKFYYGDIIYSTTDGIGGCITAICSSDGNIIRRVYPCVTSTTTLTTTFHFETASTIPLIISTSEQTLSTSVKPPATQVTTHSTPCNKENCTWTSWIDVYLPSFKLLDGDFETFENIRAARINICQNPKNIKCRAQDFPDMTIEELGQEVTCNVTHGLVCNNSDQNDHFCYNYQVQFLCCSLVDCEHQHSTKSVTTITSSKVSCIPDCEWSQWFDVSNFGSNSDNNFKTYEYITNSGFEVCQEPNDIQCRSADYPGISLEVLKEKVQCNVSNDLVCRNEEQIGSFKYCSNYEIRVYCCSGCESTKSIPTKHSVSTKHVTTPSKVTTSLHQTTKSTVTSLPRESTTSSGTLTTVEEVQTSTPKIPKTTGAITTTLEKTTENPTSLPTQRPVTTKPIKVFTTSQKLASTQTIKPPTKSREVTTTFETTGKVTSAKASTTSHKATTELERESATSETPGKVTKAPTESHRETSQSSTTTSKSFPPTQCMCNVNGKMVPPDQDIYNTSDNAGWCFYAKCNQDCKVEKYSEPCHTSTVPTSTSSTKPTQTVTSSTSTQTIKMTNTTNIPEETTSTSVSTTVSTTNPGCTDLTPPRMLNETWIMDKCTEARCIGQNEIAIIKKPCPSLNEKACANLLAPKKILDNGGCCYDLECDCVCGGWRTSHYITFDGTYYSFNGNCTYVLVQQISPVFNHFRVYIDNFSCNPDDPTCVTTLLIMFHTETIVLKSQSFNKTVANQIYVNGERVYPAISINGITITYSGIFVIVEIPEIGAYISFNLLSFKVKLPLSKFFNNTKGHCGKCSNNRADDCILPNEQLAPSCHQMAEQWLVPNKNSSSCSSIPTSVPTSVPSVSPILLSSVPRATSAKVPSKKPQKPEITGADQPCNTPEVCTLIQSSLFEGCHSIVPPENFYQACVSDACTTVEADILCSSLQSYARSCGMKGFCIDWRERTNGLCPKKCPSHLEYNPCGPAVEPTCNSRYNDAFVNKTSEDYMEGCYCPKGTTKFNTVLDICVPICGCTGPDGLPRKPGEIWDINCQTCICDQTSLNVLCAEKDCALPAPKNCSEEGYMPVLVPDPSNPCCQVIECRCNISLCSNAKMVCKPGYEAVLYMNPDACCPVYKCEPKKVCVDREIEYQPGATVPSSQPCEKCICDENMIANTGQHLVSCVSTRCLKKCAQGFIYTDVPGECCGTCKQTDCIVDLPDNTTYLLKPGDTGSPPGDNCTIYECAHNNDRFVTVESKISCPKINLDGCAPEDIQKDDKGCCFICVKPQKTCQLVKEKNFIWVKDCHSIKLVETSYCKGSCESYSIFSPKTMMMEQYCACCEETKAKKITIGLLCPNGKMIKYSFINAVSCDCVQTLCKKEASRDIEEEDLFEEDNKSNTTVSPVKPVP